METKNYLCGGNKFAYGKGYIGLPIKVSNLPETLTIEGENLFLKTSFHISLLCVKDILKKKLNSEEEILRAFCDFIQERDISFVGYTGEFRFAQSEERKTLIARCDVSGLLDFSESLSQKLGIEVPPQPAHVTLYTLQKDMGIGLNSPQDMERKSVLIEVSEKIKNGLRCAP